ncbi:MAG TPA: hypothetical protein VGE39_07965, partial [Prosthecobacter sp.]
MTLDVRGSLKNTKPSSNPYVVFEELISNAIDSFLIRKYADSSAGSALINIEVVFSRANLLDEQEDMALVCKDNGCGIGDDQLLAFLTKDTSYKDDLPITGIGACKGAGRIQFFHHYSSLNISSTYRTDSNVLKREMQYSEPQKQIKESDFSSGPGEEDEIGATFRLEGLKESIRNQILQGQPPSSVFSSSALKKQILVAFIQRLVSLQSRLGDFEINFTT